MIITSNIEKMKFAVTIILGLFLFLNTSFSQTESEEAEIDLSAASGVGDAIQLSVTANASLLVLKGVSISVSGSNTLAYGDIYASNITQTKTITNQNGQKFLVQGNPGTNVIINYNTSVSLDNSLWALQYGGTQGTINFSVNPLPVQTLANSNYISPITVNNGGSVVLTNSSGVGKLYLWVGGKISISPNQPIGDYIGYININVSY
jgi:hypothetical protein